MSQSLPVRVITRVRRRREDEDTILEIEAGRTVTVHPFVARGECYSILPLMFQESTSAGRYFEFFFLFSFGCVRTAFSAARAASSTLPRVVWTYCA